MKSANRLIVSMLFVAALAVGFWLIALGPKRQEADTLAGQVNALRSSLAEAQTNATEAVAARRQFPTDYQQIVLLGKAVPPTDGTSSLLVELSQIAHRSQVTFSSIQLAASSGESYAATTPPATPAAPTGGSSSGVTTAAAVPPTEAAASLLPLGATIGPANLAVMPYELTFTGNFFHVADFIKGVDSLVHSGGRNVAVDGRLVTLNGFALNTPELSKGSPDLEATFSVTTYLTPPSQGVTAGATPIAPSTATPAAATTSSGESSTPASTSVTNSK
jgi:Tfp pilus assembly protein PilO